MMQSEVEAMMPRLAMMPYDGDVELLWMDSKQKFT